ncbi:MAG: hypothetical protein F6K47_38455 [Symploca sp. SIO2E6]|nr:hypothetical protein [Symploca sp. SIO2E6]
MAYSDFDLKKVQDCFQLKIVEDRDLFSHIKEIAISNLLETLLQQNVSLALAMNTEKARSELIIVNLFLELKHQLPISFFSGLDFNIDRDRGLNGFCDFIVSKSPEQLFLKAPVIATVEAKNENIVGGLGQCLAEMVAARLFNEREENNISTIYGIVTTGQVWKFLKLQDDVASIDVEDYYIKEPKKIMGILTQMINES